jgi:hypothetical protein
VKVKRSPWTKRTLDKPEPVLKKQKKKTGILLNGNFWNIFSITYPYDK